MSLSKDQLGQALYDVRMAFNGKTVDQLIQEHGTLDVARLAMAKAEANAIINHFKTAGELLVPGLGLVVGTTPVTGNSVTGKIQ